jgi:broad specificity phosphatase PhoE
METKGALDSRSDEDMHHYSWMGAEAWYNPLPQRPPGADDSRIPDQAVNLGVAGHHGDSLVLVMVGLPARGKTHTSRRLLRYLEFFYGSKSKIFNVGNYRREEVSKDDGEVVKDTTFVSAEFFNPNNEAAMGIRQKACALAIEDLRAFMDDKSSGDANKIAILDATNSTVERRTWLVNELKSHKYKTMFIENVCTNKERIEANIRAVKLGSPDYKNVDPDLAVKDFESRIKNYEDVYEPLGSSPEEDKYSWVRMVDCRYFEVNRVRGYIQSTVVQALMSTTLDSKTFYIAAMGQTVYDKEGKLGGDSDLTESGREYARRLGDFARKELPLETETCRLWIPGTRAARATVEHLPHSVISANQIRKARSHIGLSQLGDAAASPSPSGDGSPNSIFRGAGTPAPFGGGGGAFSMNPSMSLSRDIGDWVQLLPREVRGLEPRYLGMFDGATPDQFDQQEEEAARFREFRLQYRFPRGESLLDVVARLDTVILEMTRTTGVVMLVVSKAVMRILLAYWTGRSREEIPDIDAPEHCCIRLRTMTYGVEQTCFNIGP